MTEEEYAALTEVILQNLQIDLAFYKPVQMKRRLAGFIDRTQLDFEGFCTALASDSELRDALKTFLTINVTEFFRDQSQFNTLRNSILPQISAASPRLRIWSAGCSHGNEPYSVAMMLENMPNVSQYSILGTDLDDEMLAICRAGGPYPDGEMKNVDDTTKRRFLERRPEGWFVKPRLRERLTFQKQNLLSDQFGSGFDLIMCRNVVIYFSNDAKKKLNEKFVDALKPGGHLFVGGTETIFGADDLGLHRVAPCFYRKAAVDARRQAA